MRCVRYKSVGKMIAAGGAALAALTMPAVAAQASPSAIETVVVTASPLPGNTLDPNDIPAASQTLTSEDIARFGAPDALHALEQQTAGVSLSNAQDNPLQPNLFYRGFEASPLAGDAQGLAVYVNGVRFNQPFGDTVQWDLIPSNAIAGMTLEGANPVFGLNALGGSLSVHMKDGFTTDGAQIETLGGSHGYGQGDAEFGYSDGTYALYVAGTAITDSGWREHSPGRLGQVYADMGWRSGRGEVHLSLTGADSDLTGNGSSPVELLAADRAAVFTYPDNTKNLYGEAVLNGSYRLSDEVTVQGNAYLSGLRQRTLNGDASDADVCDNDPAFLCLDDDSLTDLSGNPIPNFLNGGPYAQLNQTATSTSGYGGAAQIGWKTSLMGHGNQFLFGGAVDRGVTGFSASSQVGALTPDRGFAGPGIEIDQADGSIAPVHVASDNTYSGLYASDIFDITDALALTASARYNSAKIVLRDELGTALNGSHSFSRLNPAVGVTYQFLPELNFYAGYSEANRAPTPAEFSCADPSSPCSLTNFFVGDPALKQVVARTIEAGFRGGLHTDEDSWNWSAGFYRTENSNDIMFVSSPVLGRAFFENIGDTRRQGVEASADWRHGPWQIALDYSYIDATFRSALILSSEDNPFADAGGNIHVVPGDTLPGIPQHVGKVTFAWRITPDWSVTLGGRAESGQYLRGDESNLNPTTGAYFVADASTTYRITDSIQLFGTVANLFDAKYATFGTFSPTADVPIQEAPGATNPRSLSPAPPIEAFGGIRVKL